MKHKANLGFLVAAGCIAAGCFLARWVSAAPAAVARAAPREDRAQARALLAKGKRLLREKRYQGAVRCFQKAYGFWQRREIQFNLALAYLELGDKVAAGRHLRRYLDRATPAERQALPARFIRLQQQIGVVRVQSADPQVEIWIDGQRHGTGSVVVVVLPGSRAVELRRGPRVLVRKVLEVTGGREVIWSPPPVPALRPRRRVPPPPPVRIERPGRRQLHWAFFAAAASVAVGAGAAIIYTGVRTQQLQKEYDSNKIGREFTRHKLATNVLIAVAATAAVGAGVLALFTRWRSSGGKKRRSVLLPTIVPGGAGLSFYHRY